MKAHVIVCLIALFATSYPALAQVNNSVGINTGTPDPSAVLDVYATNKGMLIPRIGTEERMNIVNPATSLLVFDMDTGAFFYFDGADWQQFNTSADSIWVIKENYIYTQHGNVAIGTDTALALLHLHSDTTSPQFLISTPDYRTIIGLDETDGTIFVNGGQGNGPMRRYLTVDTSGYLGINVTDPQALIHAYDTNSVYIFLQNLYYNVIIGLDETDGTIVIGRNIAGNVVNQLVIDTAGRVGIGTIDTDVQLNVNGKIKSEGLVISDGTNQVELGLDAQGNLNIPTNPTTFYHAYRTTDYTSSSNANFDIPWNGQIFATTGTAFSHSTTVNPAFIDIAKAGYYKITYSVSAKNVDLRKMKIQTGLYKNGVLIPGSMSYNGINGDSEDDMGNLTQTVIVYLNVGDRIKQTFRADTNSSPYSVRLLQNACSITFEKL